jgi:4-amino-4-deoxy-L-arabinose transferase-like glycosyltransferase
VHLQRPLFYVTQGLAWSVFGYHEWLGRLLSVAFGVAFVVCLWLLAERLVRRPDNLVLLRGFAIGVVLASSVFATYVVAGTADVPLAAAATGTALLLWSRRLGYARAPLVAVAAAATVLAKPTGLLALAGLALATPVIAGRLRTIEGLAGLGVGAAAALLYDALQAHRLGESLYGFMRAGNGDYWTGRGRAGWWDATLRAEWLGAGLRLILLFGLVYALARVAGARTRLALAIAGPGAIVWSIAGPVLADGGAPYPFAETGLGVVAYVLVAGSLLAAPLVGVSDPLGRRVYGALLLCVAPVAVAWMAYHADEVRFLSPAWPALTMLAAVGLTVVTLALARIASAAALVPIVGVSVLCLGNLTSVDGLGRDGWRGLLELGPSGWTNKARTEGYAHGALADEVALTRGSIGGGDRIASNDGRLSYFFPGRVEVIDPTSCSVLHGAHYFALLVTGEAAEPVRPRASTHPLSWLQCREPRLQLVRQQAGAFTLFTVGREPRRPPTLADCGIAPYPGQMYDAVFADRVDYATARAVRKQAKEAGFQHVRIEQIECSAFRVLNTGLATTAAGQADFRHEAESAGFDVSFVPAVRFPEVPADVSAMR